MQINILLFSVAREAVGQHRLQMDVEAGWSVSDVLDRLTLQHPALAPLRSVIKPAVNAEYVPESRTLQEGDELALITPVSGG